MSVICCWEGVSHTCDACRTRLCLAGSNSVELPWSPILDFSLFSRLLGPGLPTPGPLTLQWRQICAGARTLCALGAGYRGCGIETVVCGFLWVSPHKMTTVREVRMLRPVRTTAVGLMLSLASECTVMALCAG